MRIYAHALVKNEEKWIWYSLMSIIRYVDRVLVWDTGSTDRTLEIIDEIKKRFPNKVIFKQVGDVDAERFTRVRQEMLEETDSDWFIILDGDEVWWEDSIKKVIQVVAGSTGRSEKDIESVVVPMIYPIGDIYHRQEEAAGQYQLAGRRGHYALRAVNRKIPGLSSSNPHGTWGWTDGEGKMIQDRDPKKILFVDAPYMHFSLMPRGGERKDDERVVKRANKLKFELGTPFPRDFYYPEVFFKPRPDIVPSPWATMSRSYFLRAAIETPFKKIKRRFFPNNKIGY